MRDEQVLSTNADQRAARRDRSLVLSADVARFADRPRRRSSPRARGFDYLGGYRYHLTTVTRGRKPLLSDPVWAEQAVTALLSSAEVALFDVDAYCVMPDHVHVLIRGESPESSLHRFAHRFKQTVGFAFKQRTGEQLWHRSYHDHVLRPDEPSLPHVEYILANPVEAGLVGTECDWPFSGPRWWFDEQLNAVSAYADRLKTCPYERVYLEPAGQGGHD